MLKKNIIKTYSRRQPLTFFKPTTSLIAKYTDPDNNVKVRESHLNDKTLVVDDLNDTFDKIATGVIVPSTRIESNDSDFCEISDQNNSEDVFKIPSQLLKKRKRSEEIEIGQSSEVDSSLAKRKNLVQATINDNKIKRKKLKKNEKEKKERQQFKDKENCSLKKCLIPLKRCDIETDIKKCEINIANISQDENSFNVNNYNSSSSAQNIQVSQDIPKIMHLKVVDNLPTSTPREQKLRKVVDMQNISPIVHHKQNKNNNDENKELASIVSPKKESIDKITSGQSNINSHINILSKESELVKSRIIITDQHISKNSELKNYATSIFNDTKNEMFKLSENNSINAINNQISHESNNLLKQSDLQKDSNNHHEIKTPTTNEKIKYNTVCNDSPLLFEDTEENLSTQVVNQDSIKNFSKSKLPSENSNENNKIINGSNRSSGTSKNESSFYPHEWSNEYDSSYEYFTQKKNFTEKESDLKDYNNLEKVSEKFNVSISKNNLSILSTENSLQKINTNKGIESINKISSNDLSSLIKNSIESDNEISNIKNNDFNKNNTSDGEIDNKQTMTISKKNFNESEQDSRNSNSSSKVNVSNITLKNIENERKIQISHETIEVDPFDVKDDDNFNKDNQTDTSIKLYDYEQKEDIQNKQKDNKLNNKELHLHLIKIDDQKLEKDSSLNNTLKRKRINENENRLERIEYIDRSTNDPNMITKYSELDIQNLENNLSVLSKRISKKSKVNSSQNDDISVRNEQINTESDTELESNNPEKCYKNQIKEIETNSITSSQELSKIVFKSSHKNIKDKFSILPKSTVLKKKSKRKKTKSIPDFDLQENNDNKNNQNKLDKNTNHNFKLDRNVKQKKALKLKELRIFLTKIDIQNVYKKSSILSQGSIKENSKIMDLGKQAEDTDVENRQKNIKISQNNMNSANYQEDNLKGNIVIDVPKNTLQHKEINKVLNGEKLDSHLSKLNNSVAITMRRNVHKQLSRPLAAIAEYEIEQLSSIIDEEENTVKHNSSKTDNFNANQKSEEDNHNKSIKDNQRVFPIFLKPGKFWSRSLSIINNFHNVQNLEELAVGRGQNWRHSVQSILNMQVEGIVQNNSRHRNIDNNLTVNLIQRTSDKISTIATSPSRISRRFSIRIIPSDTRLTLNNELMQSQMGSFIDSKTRKTSVSRKTSLKIQRDTIFESEEDLIKSAETIILKRCKQTSYLSFDTCFSDSYLDHCRKIGEGVYGEVFLYESETEKSVLKIIPIEGKELVNCEPQKKFHEILSEIIISEELHKLKFEDKYKTNGFVDINRIMCVIGKYPYKLIDLWKTYDKERKSENDCPSMFNDQQLYIILELAHGGQDLEAHTFQNASESLSIFLQTAFSLAVAEQSLEFEHRDLHWGNILISKTEDTTSYYKLANKEITLPTKGVKVSIIDFTLSRMSYEGCKIFNDLAADPTLFTAQGEYQFDIYRMMKTSVNNDWQQFNPVTNVFWLDYTLDKMITGVRYKRKTTKVHKTSIEQMKQLRKEILNFSSAFDFVRNNKMVTAIVNSK